MTWWKESPGFFPEERWLVSDVDARRVAEEELDRLRAGLLSISDPAPGSVVMHHTATAHVLKADGGWSTPIGTVYSMDGVIGEHDYPGLPGIKVARMDGTWEPWDPEDDGTDDDVLYEVIHTVCGGPAFCYTEPIMSGTVISAARTVLLDGTRAIEGMPMMCGTCERAIGSPAMLEW